MAIVKRVQKKVIHVEQRETPEEEIKEEVIGEVL